MSVQQYFPLTQMLSEKAANVPRVIKSQPRKLLAHARRKERSIKLCQEKLLGDKLSCLCKACDYCFNPQVITSLMGGILSISSIYEETRRLEHIHHAETIMCTSPGDPLLLKYTKFENQNHIYGFSEALSFFQNFQSLKVNLLRSLAVQDTACELIVVDNCNNQFHSLSAALNYGACAHRLAHQLTMDEKVRAHES